MGEFWGWVLCRVGCLSFGFWGFVGMILLLWWVFGICVFKPCLGFWWVFEFLSVVGFEFDSIVGFVCVCERFVLLLMNLFWFVFCRLVCSLFYVFFVCCITMVCLVCFCLGWGCFLVGLVYWFGFCEFV